jgi:hypothetical protein
MLVGAMQLGIMYLLSFRAYLYLTVSEFLLFTVLTPLYITLIYDLLSDVAALGLLLSALLAVIGAAIIRYDKVSDHFWTGLMLVQLQYQLRYRHGGLQAPDGNASDAAAQRLCLVLYGALSWRWRPGLCWVTAENADHHAAVGHSGLAGRGGIRAGLLYVELRRHPGGCRYAGHHEQRACAGRAAGEPRHLAGAAALAELYYWGSVILASLWVHRRWVAPHSAQTADDRRRGSALSE